MNKVYHFSVSFRNTGLLILALMGVLCLFVLPFAIFSPQGLWVAMAFALALLPFVLLGGYFFVRHSGEIILTDDAITLSRFGREKRVSYLDVIAVRQDYHLPPNLVLSTADTSLKFSRLVYDWPELDAALRRRIAAFGQTDQATFPLVLGFGIKFFATNGLLLAVLFAFIELLAFGAFYERYGVWRALGMAAVVSGSLVGLTWAAAVLATLLSGQPIRCVFTADSVEARYAFGKRRSWAARDIQAIHMEEHQSAVQSGYVKVERLLHPVIITFKDGQPLIINPDRARDFGYTPERLNAVLRRLYAVRLGQAAAALQTPQSPRNQAQANKLIQQASQFHKRKQYEQAIALYKEAIELFPPYASYWFLIGDMYFEMKQPEPAAQAYRQTVEFVPEHDQAWSSLGRCLLLLGQPEKAASAFDRSIEIAADQPEAFYYGAMAQARLNNQIKASAYLEHALALQPAWKEAARQDPLLASLMQKV